MAKAVQKQALGRGLSALLKDPANDIKSVNDKNADKVVGSIIELDIDTIEINPFQPRTNFNEESLQELASSIKLIGLTTIPSYIRIANDNESLVMALVENIQRHDLDPIEIALSYQRLIDEIQLTQEQMSERVGKKRSTITNYLRLLKLDPIIQTGIRDGFISMGHGRAIINIDNQDVQADIYQKIVSQNLSVRDTEALVKNYQDGLKPKAKTTKSGSSFTIADDQKKAITNFFGAKVEVKVAGNGKGKISIPFHSEEDFNRIIKLINS